MTEEQMALTQQWTAEGVLAGLFDAEPLIIARLTAEVPGLATVASSSLIAGTVSFTDLLPAAFIEPGGGSIVDGQGGYGRLYDAQGWSVMLTVRQWAQQPGDSSASGIAGPLALQIIGALDRWCPGDGFEPMFFTDHLDPVSSVGWAMFELKFTLGVTI